MIVVQCDGFNLSRIATILCVPLTSNIRWVDAPGNVLIRGRDSGLDRDLAANVSLVFAADRTQLDEHVGRIERRLLDRVLDGLNVVLGR